VQAQEEKSNTAAPARTNLLLYGALAVALTGIYMLLWWNRGLAANSTWNVDAQLFLAGKFPYRDFYVFHTPVHFLVKLGLLQLFGDSVVPLRAFGVFERLVLVGITFYWTSRRCNPFASFVGSVTMGIACSGATSEMLIHYNFQAILFSLIAGIAGSKVLQGKISGPVALRLTSIAGIFASLSFFAKQPTGLGMSTMLFVFLPLVYRDNEDRPRRAAVALAFAMGWALPCIGFGIWLYSNGALAAAIDQTLISGPTAKGSLWSVILRPIILTFGSITTEAALCGALILLVATYLLIRRGTTSPVPGWTGARSATLFWLPATLALIAGVILSRAGGPAGEAHVLNALSFVFIYLCQLAAVITAAWYARRWMKRGLEDGETQLWFQSVFCLTLLYTFSMSFPVFEIMFVPVLAFLVAYTLDYLEVRRKGAAFASVCALCLSLITIEVCHKLISPYDWDIWADANVWTATVESHAPQLKGILLDPKSAAFIDRVTADIRTNSRPGDPVLIFPSFPLFYSLADRRPNTFTVSHFTDITPDRIAIADGKRIAAEPPQVIVLIETDEGRFAVQEKMYRSGAKSGQRQLRDQLQEMVKGYRLIDSLDIPTSGIPVKIYVRN
jgi:hypothetical protein